MNIFKYISAVIMAFVVSTIAAPAAQVGHGITETGHAITPHYGGTPGSYWYIHDVQLTFPSGNTRNIVSNVTQNMPGWNTNWVPGSTSLSAVEKKSVGSGIVGHVINSCSFPVYVQTAIGANDIVSPIGLSDPAGTSTYTVAPGGHYVTEIRAVINGKGGVAVKISRDATLNPSNNYEMEYAQAANPDGHMAIWYDLSSLKGNPFGDVKRFMQVTTSASACLTIYNAPGSTAGDWPANQVDCKTVGDAYIYLC